MARHVYIHIGLRLHRHIGTCVIFKFTQANAGQCVNKQAVEFSRTHCLFLSIYLFLQYFYFSVCIFLFADNSHSSLRHNRYNALNRVSCSPFLLVVKLFRYILQVLILWRNNHKIPVNVYMYICADFVTYCVHRRRLPYVRVHCTRQAATLTCQLIKWLPPSIALISRPFMWRERFYNNACICLYLMVCLCRLTST